MGAATVLYIDDHPHLLELRKATLESYGYHVRIASSGCAAMRILREASVAAVLLEYRVEGMDAEAVACHIKQRFPKLPIILLSAYSEMPERILWLVDDYVMKSEVPEGLSRVIQRTTRSANTEEAHKLAPAGMACELFRCDRPAALPCSNCRRKVCVEHAIESGDSGEMLCSYCAIPSKGLWRRVRPIPVNGSEQSRTKKRAA